MPQLMPLYWSFSIFMFMFIFMMMIIVFSDNLSLSSIYENKSKFIEIELDKWLW